MKTNLVTGVNGFIGRNLAKVLLEKGEYVYGVDIFMDTSSELNEYKNFTPIKVEKDNFNAIDLDVIQALDVVYHLGWAGQLGGSDLNDFNLQIGNVHMTAKLLEKMVEVGMKKFVFCGSISHYKMAKDAYNVNADIYGLSKMYAGKLS
ncbi:MAG: NAD(P)-dependent oxidoreductase, partial [Coprobacillus sp.]